MRLSDSPFPSGLKPGDFIQASSHFADVFFEVKSVIAPREGSSFWMVTFWTYDKYAPNPRVWSVNSAGSIRAVIGAEMAEPVMRFKGLRYQAKHGQYDPIDGYAPIGTSLRQRAAA